MLHVFKNLQVQQLAFEQAKQAFNHSVVKTVPFAAHALANSFCSQHLLILFVLVLPALVRVENQVCAIGYLRKCCTEWQHFTGQFFKGEIA